MDDEEPKRGGSPSKMAQIKPAFAKDGTITAANASKISDGASAVILASEKAVKSHGLTPIARLLSYSGTAQQPEWFTTAPATCISRLLSKLGMTSRDVDLYEISEAFAVVAMHSIQACDLDPSAVNVNGGAIALGHPIGCSGTRIVTTLIHALADRRLSKGIASICIGGGEALALAVERT
jgi:acetyl-CoA C-acetyltransferase